MALFLFLGGFMPVKDALRTCKCKFCDKKFTMFYNQNGELIFFPENTTRAAWGYYELMDHVRKEHSEVYGLIKFSNNLFKEQVVDCYNIT